ncbi:MAG: flagellar hook-associated protein FlgL [Desulfobacterales bacterium]
MRVPTVTTFGGTTYQLGKITTQLSAANTAVVTGKRINTLSDDPVGLSQVLSIRSSLSNIDQLARNIATGRTWLNAGEAALGTAKDLITEAKTLSIQMVNGGVSDADRADAAEQIEGILLQMEELANTSVNGRYIFAGTRTDLKPFELDQSQDPPLSYSGNRTEFAVKTGSDAAVTVGHDGAAVFWDATLAVDDTNNRLDFSEDGVNPLTATIPDGEYSHTELARIIEREMENASASAGGGLDYTVAYDEAGGGYSITRADAGGLSLLWQSGPHAGVSIAADLGFDPAADATGAAAYTGDSQAQWGVFNTLVDLKGYLASGDIDGIERSLSRLDTSFNHMVTTVSTIGARELRLDMKENIIADLEVSLSEKRSQLEDVDVIEAISNLQAIQYAYEAALGASAKVMRTSLVDYL